MRKSILLVSAIFLMVACSEEDDFAKNLPSTVDFIYLPTDLSEMLEFGPIGQVRVLPKAHGGFRLNAFRYEPTIPVYAMSDGIIYNIRSEKQTINDHFAPAEYIGVEYDDFAIEIAVAQTARMWYGHVSKLSDLVLDAAPNIKSGRGVENKVNIHVKAGQILGYIGPHPGFDIGFFDSSKENYFVNPARYNDQYRQAQPWTDYLRSELLEQVWLLNPRTVEPLGGAISYDIDNTVSGNWFREGTTSMLQWSRQMAIVRHELFGDRITIADASPLVDGDGQLNDGLESYLWWIIGNAPLPEHITFGSNMVKYEVAPPWRFHDTESPEPYGTVAIQMTGNRSLTYEWFEGVRAVNVTAFTNNARKYVR